MRVIGGVWRGRRLTAPAGRSTRPTADRVREAIFDVLPTLVGAWPAGGGDDAHERAEPIAGADGQLTGNAGADGSLAGYAGADGQLAGHVVLDLFAGAGGLGIEALSRGAAACTFVENDAAALRALRANLSALDVPAARARVCATDYQRVLIAGAAGASRYTLLFVDPPYATYATVEADLVRWLGELLMPGAVVVAETARGQVIDLPLAVARVKLYGDTQVTFLLAAPD